MGNAVKIQKKFFGSENTDRPLTVIVPAGITVMKMNITSISHLNSYTHSLFVTIKITKQECYLIRWPGNGCLTVFHLF